MKQKDIALILVVVFISAVASFVVSNMIFASPSNRQQQVEVVDSPDVRYFNNNSIDPTQLIQIGNNNNTNPFNGSSQ
jgi:hypothetical protein